MKKTCTIIEGLYEAIAMNYTWIKNKEITKICNCLLTHIIVDTQRRSQLTAQLALFSVIEGKLITDSHHDIISFKFFLSQFCMEKMGLPQ